ncbi:MAG: DUF2914 domain-containing protein [Alphaproteobacteria bacterium]|nr:DUF2914 domain-containing protein [Alphaproteobacteria bacterium]
MIKSWISRFIVAAITLNGMISNAFASDATLTIKEAVWTSGVSEMKYTDRLGERTQQRGISLWTLVEGDQASLDLLEKQGKFPLRHSWKHYLGAIPDLETLIPRDAISLGVGKAELINDLRMEAKMRGGRFDWRTWSSKKNLEPGNWIVEILYKDGTPVACATGPCVYTILVER